MNKLTTISTIKKTAPLALLAVVMSGSAFAGPGKGPNKDPQASIDAFNLCYLDNQFNEDTGAYDLKLVVETSITNTSGDTPVDAEFSQISVDATQKTRGKPDSLAGTTSTFDPAKKIAQGATLVHTETFDVCSALLNPYQDTSLNAEIGIVIENAGGNGSFSGRCDDDLGTWCQVWDPVSETMVDEYCEEEDESIVEVKAGSCP